MGRTFGWSIVSTLIDAFHRLRDAIHNARHGQESFDAIGAVKQAGMYLISTERGRIGVAFFAVLATAVFLAPRWIWRLLYAIKCLLTLLVSVRTHALRFGGKNYSFADEFESRVDKTPDIAQFISADDGTTATFSKIDQIANQVGHWALQRGLRPNDTVALMMSNRAEYCAFWMGMAKVAVRTALINTNAVGKALTHSVEVATSDNSGAKILVIDRTVQAKLSSSSSSSSSDVHEMFSRMGVIVLCWEDLYEYSKPQKNTTRRPRSRTNSLIDKDKDNDNEESKDSNEVQGSTGDDSSDSSFEISAASSTRPAISIRGQVLESDVLLYIFTSGTTGLPKASRITHTRFRVACEPFRIFCQLCPSDRIYSPMPLYHSSAGMLGTGACILSGACMVLRRKFSVKSFTSDCLKHNVTNIQYIGELCRYLCSPAFNSDDDKLKIRNAFGNGLRPDIWRKFQKRYRVSHIVEFYAATEGNVALFNATDRVGSIGYVPRLFDFLYPTKIITSDEHDKSFPMRNEDGLCSIAKADEVGLLVGVIGKKNSAAHMRFDGYSDPAASAAKVLDSVFAKGDQYFNTGDLVSRDKHGFFFWADRTGDTYRWKGENIGTAEVEQVVGSVQGVADCTVYGVLVPSYEGRAGMAAIKLDHSGPCLPTSFSWDKFLEALDANLQPCARPVFVRFVSELPMTSTFKHIKNGLINDGYAPQPGARGHGQVFVLRPREGEYGKYEEVNEEALAQLKKAELVL